MCGIIGEFIFRGDRQVDAHVLTVARDTMTHRGPDDDGLWLNASRQVGLGHRRLSIVDLSEAGHQPMSNEDGTVWIVFNGEIYNHGKLRPELEKLGHRYRSRSDTETILHLYEEYGEDCVNHLDGMFAFGIWDENRQRLFLARDRLGKKPLYFWRDGERLVFASEIKALLKHPAVPKQPNAIALYHYLSFSATPAPHTMFAGIQKLKPAECLVVNSGGSTLAFNYWTPFAGSYDVAALSPQECATELVALLKKSIEKRMMSDVPFGVFLSGGVDSSTNVALMNQLMNRPVDTFSVALEGDEESNEFGWARQVAQHFHCEHHEIVVNTTDFLKFANEMPHYQDEPLADPVCVPLYYVSKLARDNGVIVVQVGEGSDEIFAGYLGYRDVLQRHRWSERWWRPMPEMLKDLAVAAAPRRQSDFLRRLRDNEEIFWGGAIAFYESEKRSMLAPSFLQQVPNLSSWDPIRKLYDEAKIDGGHPDFLHQMIYVELKQRLAELLMMRVDKMSMAASVETRAPFLDQHLVEFALRIPTALKLHNGTSKYILKEAMRPLLPPGIVDRPKQGFCGSAANMLQREINDRMISDIRGSAFLKELIRPEAIARLTDPQQGDLGRFKLWNLWNLALWHRRWFE